MPLIPKWVKSKGLLFKRTIDLSIGSAALVSMSPLALLTGVSVYLSMGAPILFRQSRPGFAEEPFELIKFRTMRDAAPGEVWYRTDSDRLTRVGKVIRKLSLDELPTLINVVRGEMSLVGPRPLLLEYLSKYTEKERMRHHVPPGVTGWAQINGRQHIPFSKRLELDLWYVENQSTMTDMKILLLTPLRVFIGSGVESGQDLDSIDDIGLSADVVRRDATDGPPT